MPDKLSQADIDLLRQSSLFDEAYYLTSNPDLAAKGVDPVKHYLRRGAAQGRDPSPEFSTTGYLRNNQDINKSGVNPLVHYLRHGRAEGRTANPFAVEAAMVVESGLFDEDYYRHYFPELPTDEDPVVHYLRVGAELGLDPSERFSTRVYLRRTPTSPRRRATRSCTTSGSVGRRAGWPTAAGCAGRCSRRCTRNGGRTCSQCPLVHVPTREPRVTVLTDSVNAASFFGGVGTALILGILLANRTGASLRLATRTDAPDGRVVAELEKAHGLALSGPLELSHVPIDGTRALAVGPGDVIVTTSWWTTRAVLDSTLPRDQVVYLLQEDERMFYPWGDDRLLCQETLAEPDLAVVVNTRRLLDHLTTSGAITVADATSFEPAFPGIEPARREPGAKRQLFFYSRPENARNLFWRGGLALSRAIEKRVLDPEVWDFHFVGRATRS